MIEALNILEGFDLRGHELNSADYIHTLVEALKLAYADRDTYYGDPKFVKIPAERLLSKEYGAERRKLISARGFAGFPAGQRGAEPAQASLLLADRALQDRRRAAGQGHHLRGRHRQRRRGDFDHAFGRVDARR